MTQTSLFDPPPAKAETKQPTPPKPVKTPKAKQPKAAKAPEPKDPHADGKAKIKTIYGNALRAIAERANGLPEALWCSILDTFLDLGSMGQGQHHELEIAALCLGLDDPSRVRSCIYAREKPSSMYAALVVVLSHIIDLDPAFWAEDAEQLIAEDVRLTEAQLLQAEAPPIKPTPPKAIKGRKKAKAPEPEPELDEDPTAPTPDDEYEVPLEDPDDTELCERCLAPAPHDELVRLDGLRQCRTCRAPKGTPDSGPELDSGLLDRIKANLLSTETP